ATGGVGPYTFAVTGGALPPGLALDASGLLSGTPTQAGTFSFTVQATDSSPAPGPFVGTRDYTLTVASVAPLVLFATGAGPTGGPHVKVNNADGSLRFSFYAYDPSFAGGVSVAVADVNGDGIPDIITGAGFTGGPHVRVFSGKDLSVLASFYAY